MDMSAYYQQILTYAGINAILALGMFLAMAPGQMSFGQGAFMAIGAYTYAVLSVNFDLPFVLSIIIAILSSCFAGLIVAIPVARLRGIYLGLFTFICGDLIVAALENIEYLGGSRGFHGIPLHTGLFSTLIILVILYLLIQRTLQSPVGMALKAIKANEISAQSLGIRSTRLKIVTFALGAAITGLGGALYATNLGSIEPKVFGFAMNINILVWAIVGGGNVLLGPIIGAVGLTLAKHLLGDFSLLLYGVLLIVVMTFRPDGLLRSEITLQRFRNGFSGLRIAGRTIRGRFSKR